MSANVTMQFPYKLSQRCECVYIPGMPFYLKHAGSPEVAGAAAEVWGRREHYGTEVACSDPQDAAMLMARLQTMVDQLVEATEMGGCACKPLL